jgi:spermidine/putrescine transport system permease protein
VTVAHGIGVGERSSNEVSAGNGKQPTGGGSGRRGRRITPYLLLLPGLGWLAVFFAVPIVTLISTSTQTRPSGAEIGVYVQTFRLANYVDALQEYATQFGRSFLYAFAATALALAISYPLAYAIAFKAGRWRNLLLVLVVAPFFTSFLLRTVAWKQILADDAWVADGLRFLHVLGPTDHVINTPVAVVVGITYNFLPFMILPIYASLERVDPRFMEAAGDLYASAITTFRRVTLPLSMPGVVAGTLLTFIPAAGDYVNSALLGNRNTSMVGNVIDSRFLRVVDYPTAAVLSVVLMVSILVLVAAYIRRSGTEELV